MRMVGRGMIFWRVRRDHDGPGAHELHGEEDDGVMMERSSDLILI